IARLARDHVRKVDDVRDLAAARAALESMRHRPSGRETPTQGVRIGRLGGIETLPVDSHCNLLLLWPALPMWFFCRLIDAPLHNINIYFPGCAGRLTRRFRTPRVCGFLLWPERSEEGRARYLRCARRVA